MKGRGTRKHNFREELFDRNLSDSLDDSETEKTEYMLFDFFANCEYFEDEYNYDQTLTLPKVSTEKPQQSYGGSVSVSGGAYEHLGADIISSIKVETVGTQGMRIDRMYFDQFSDAVRDDEVVKEKVEEGQWDYVVDYVKKEFLDKKDSMYTLEKLRKAAEVDRRLSLREILERVFDLIPNFKSKDELLEEEFSKFIADYQVEDASAIPALKTYFKAYITNDQVRHIIETKQYTQLATNPNFSTRDLKSVPVQYREIIPNYIKDYVSLNQFTA